MLGAVVAVGGCTASEPGNGGDNPVVAAVRTAAAAAVVAAAAASGDGGGGGDMNVDDGVLPTYPTQHPRIYLTPQQARLEAALAANTPAATRFKAKVDTWVGGGDICGFQAWNAALLGQLTGDAAYCTKAVAAVEAQVAAAEAPDRRGKGARGRGRQLPRRSAR